jgi:hypothetical protein
LTLASSDPPSATPSPRTSRFWPTSRSTRPATLAKRSICRRRPDPRPTRRSRFQPTACSRTRVRKSAPAHGPTAPFDHPHRQGQRCPRLLPASHAGRTARRDTL